MTLIRRRMLWWPTWKGWLLLFFLVSVLPFIWTLWGEEFLADTDRREGAGILVVEGWIGRIAIGGAVEEFEKGGYKKIVAAGCWSEEGEAKGQWSFAQVAARELRRRGVSPEDIIEIPLGKVERHRTFATAEAVAEHLQSDAAKPLLEGGINVFTRGSHARRSGVVYRKAFDKGISVGRIGWWSNEDRDLKWWESTARTKEFLTETCVYWFEVLFDGGR